MMIWNFYKFRIVIGVLVLEKVVLLDSPNFNSIFLKNEIFNLDRQITGSR